MGKAMCLYDESVICTDQVDDNKSTCIHADKCERNLAILGLGSYALSGKSGNGKTTLLVAHSSAINS